MFKVGREPRTSKPALSKLHGSRRTHHVRRTSATQTHRVSDVQLDTDPISLDYAWGIPDHRIGHLL
eukprot:9893463-Alexandrium_andersonii.AAC.1